MSVQAVSMLEGCDLGIFDCVKANQLRILLNIIVSRTKQGYIVDLKSTDTIADMT